MPLVKTAVDIIGKKWAHLINPDELERLAREGHAPHWVSPDGRRFFESDSIKDWLFKQYLTHRDGIAIPSVLPVVLPDLTVNRVPVALRELAHLLRGIPRASGVYFLIKDLEIVYVGRSVEVVTRVWNHIFGKDFDDAMWLPIPESMQDSVEAAFITVLKPRLNGKGTIPVKLKDQDHEAIIAKVSS